MNIFAFLNIRPLHSQKVISFSLCPQGMNFLRLTLLFELFMFLYRSTLITGVREKNIKRTLKKMATTKMGEANIYSQRKERKESFA